MKVQPMPISPQPQLSSTALLDQAPLSPDEIDHLSELVAHTLGTTNDIILVQSEAIVALEAIAKSVAGPGIKAFNVVTGPYGVGFGNWMREVGSDVTDFAFPFERVADAEITATEILRHRPQIVSLVHAEAATGGTNDAATIIDAAHQVGAITVLDAVASIGAEPVLTDKWNVDIVAIGAQKALAGPAGMSAVSVSQRAWEFIDANSVSPSGSALSLTDWRDSWLRSDRLTVPGLPNWLEGRALTAALERIHNENLAQVTKRHNAAAQATLAGIEALGLAPWQQGDPVSYAPVATAISIAGFPQLLALNTGLITQGGGVLGGKLLRINHYGLAASLDSVNTALRHLAHALKRDLQPALEAAQLAWDERCL